MIAQIQSQDDHDLDLLADALSAAAKAVSAVKRARYLASSPKKMVPNATSPNPLKIALGLIAGYRRRAFIFGNRARLFRDPAWLMMLELFVASEKGESVATGALTAASQAPTASALRYLARLEDLGFVCRNDDMADRRRTNVSLSPSGVELMTRFLAARSTNT